MIGRRTANWLFSAVVGWAVLISAARAQDSGPETKYWPLQKISFPVDADRLQSLNPKPVKLRFYAAPKGGKFEMVSERRIDDLEEIVDQNNRVTRRGFNYTSRSDGTEEFALQYVFANNDVAPLTTKLTPQYRIVFDTRPPAVRLTATAATSVEWVVDDENLITDSVRLEVKYQEQSKWTPVGVRAFSTRDRYTWNNIPPGKVIEVRLVVKDKASHEGVSQVVRLPATNTGRGGSTPAGSDPLGGRAVGTSFGGPDDLKARPQIEYVNTSKLTVRSKFTKVTRSGIESAILWVNDGKSGWKEDSRKAGLAITMASKDPQVEMPYLAPKDGLYGFIVLPVNGANGKPEDPRDGDPAQWLVEVDTVAPQVEVRAVRVVPGGLSGPRIEIEWNAVDKNMMPEPITIEYQEIGAKDQEWKPIAVKIPNTSRYIWEIEDKNLWRFNVRVTAVDLAGNSTRAQYKEPVLVDLDKPSAVIEKVQGSGPPVRQSNRIVTDPLPTTPASTGTPVLDPVPAPRTPEAKIPQPEIKTAHDSVVNPTPGLVPLLEPKPVVPPPSDPKPEPVTPPPVKLPEVTAPAPTVPVVPSTPTPTVPVVPSTPTPTLPVVPSTPTPTPMTPTPVVPVVPPAEAPSTIPPAPMGTPVIPPTPVPVPAAPPATGGGLMPVPVLPVVPKG